MDFSSFSECKDYIKADAYRYLGKQGGCFLCILGYLDSNTAYGSVCVLIFGIGECFSLCMHMQKCVIVNCQLSMVFRYHQAQ